jgi:hypothetical protein
LRSVPVNSPLHVFSLPFCSLAFCCAADVPTISVHGIKGRVLLGHKGTQKATKGVRIQNPEPLQDRFSQAVSS